MKTMKFVLRTSSVNSGRTGTMTDIPRLPGVSIQTPALMLYTKGASIPHITHEVLQMLTQEPHAIQLPLLTTLQMQVGVKSQGESLAHFSGLGEHPSLMVLQDPTAEIPHTKLEKYHMPLWTRMGKKEIDADMYMDLVECFKPDMYANLCDGCTDDSSSKKRISKSLERTAAMFSTCLKRHISSTYLSNNSSLLGVIEGGNTLDQRERSLEQLLENCEHLGGFILDGIDSNGPLLETRSFESIQNIVNGITKRLPEDKLRMSQGCWNPVMVLDLVSAGWDLFDSSLPFQSTERGCALTFSFELEKSSIIGEATDKMALKSNVDSIDSCYEINLRETRYAEDFGPILQGCMCLCCSKYSRAYINHLLTTSELLSSVLLMIHNLHHYMQFFKSIRKNATTERLAQMRAMVHKQYSQHEDRKNLEGPKTVIVEKKRRRRLSEDSITSAEDNKTKN